MKHGVAAALGMSVLLGPGLAMAQDAGLTFAQVKSEYRQMSPVHIAKCDHDGNGVYTRTEMLCVSSIYQQFYLDGN